LSNEKIISIDREIMEKVRAGLNTIKVTSKEKDIRKEAEKLFDFLSEQITLASLSLEERILQKMRETKTTDPDMNANLYILHRKLVNGQIDKKQALEMFEMYVKIEPYETKMY
jgi:hypothetical protein